MRDDNKWEMTTRGRRQRGGDDNEGEMTMRRRRQRGGDDNEGEMGGGGDEKGEKVMMGIRVEVMELLTASCYPRMPVYTRPRQMAWDCCQPSVPHSSQR